MTNPEKLTRGSSSSLSFGQTASTATHAPGGQAGLKYIPQEVVRIVEPVLIALRGTTNKSIAAQVSELVMVVVELLLQLGRMNVEVTNLPRLHGANLDDGTFLIEWLSANYRVGFVIDVEPKESIWYLIRKEESSNSNSSGSLAGPEKRTVLSQLVSYVAMNS